MLPFKKANQKFATFLLTFILAGSAGNGQSLKREQPTWWFGASAAANLNFYRGTTQMLNEDLRVPTAFHKGKGVKPYISLLTEYRPNKVWGGMLNMAFDNRGGKFDGVMAPCNCPARLSTNVSYISLEPSIRLAPFASSFYIFAGPTLGFNIAKTFTYTQEKQTDTRAEWSDIRKIVLSAQAGAGIDLPISAKTNPTQMTLSPFVSFQTDFGHDARSVESWAMSTLRAGVAFKFGKIKKVTPTVASPVTTTVIAEKQVVFTVRAPLEVPVSRMVKESFPFRNSVFFDQGSTEIPNRYVMLSNSKAASFNEEKLQQDQPDNLNNGRSIRQLAVYHNILNIIGDRMRANPQSSIALSGASDKNPAEGKIMAENIKKYLVAIFDINPSRITTEGRDKPLVPSEQPGATKELALLREGDRRVDIGSTSPELLLQVGGTNSAFLKPVVITSVDQDPLDSHVLFNVDGANELLESWSVEIVDDKGNTQQYGPYTQDQASVSGKTILGTNTDGKYTIVMSGQTKSGQSVRKENVVSLLKNAENKQEGLRHSILFDFDKSTTITSYEKFLAEVVTPQIPENSTVIIHGHTDIIGDEKYNQTLSTQRAMAARQIIERALLNAGKKGVKFETLGFGEDNIMSPFENNLPEERFYNRTVIIDIIPAK